MSCCSSVECGLTDVLFQSKIGAWILAFRILLLKETTRKDDWDRALKLEANEASNRYNAPELMKEALIAVFFARIVTNRKGHKKFDLGLALLAHHLMRVVRFNCHEVVTPDPATQAKVKVGLCLNLNLAMINHSCDPNYGRVWSRDLDLVLAHVTRPVKKGEQVFDVYSGVYYKEPAEERTVTHERYHFDCGCEACEEIWPLFDLLPDEVKGLPEGYYQEGVSDADRDKVAGAVKALRKKGRKATLEETRRVLVLAHSVLRSPHAVLLRLEEQLHDLLWRG